MRQVWLAQGLEPTDFDDMFSMYVNTQHVNDYNVGTTAQVMKKNKAYVGVTDAVANTATTIEDAAKNAIKSLTGN